MLPCRKLVWEKYQGRVEDKATADAKKAKESRDVLASLMRHLHPLENVYFATSRC